MTDEDNIMVVVCWLGLVGAANGGNTGKRAQLSETPQGGGEGSSSSSEQQSESDSEAPSGADGSSDSDSSSGDSSSDEDGAGAAQAVCTNYEHFVENFEPLKLGLASRKPQMTCRPRLFCAEIA